MAGYAYGNHLRQEHWKGKKKWLNCLECQIYYATWCSIILYFWKINNKHMDSIIQWILIVIAISIPTLIGALFNYFLNKKKVKAETESIQLKNKITKDITYDQLKKENKHKDVKNKIEILKKLIVLEEEIKNKENKSASDHKKLKSLEMIKKEFKQTFAEENEAKSSEAKENKKSIESVKAISKKGKNKK